VWILFAFALALLWRRPRVLVLVAVAVLTADVLALGAKVLTGRPRPYIAHPEPEPLIGTPLDLSFPSGHGATAFAGATVLAVFAPRLAVPLYLLAAGIAWSRVYVGVHYPLDVIAGAILGVGVAFTLLLLARRLVNSDRLPLPHQRKARGRAGRPGSRQTRESDGAT
jgi:undecaprenyl-diphosphatase